jgi:hypothetical protein
MERNQRIQKERKRLTPHPICTMPILMHWNLSLTFFPTVRPASGEASFSLYYIKHAQDPGAAHRHSQSASLPCPARTEPAGTLPCPARSQPLSRAQHAQSLQGLSRAQPAPAGHRHSQSAPLPFLPGRARSAVRDGPELRHGQT